MTWSAAGKTSSYSARMESVRSSAIRDLFAAASRSDVISFSGGMPEVASVPALDVARVAHDAIEEHSAIALQYGSSEGRPGLRDTIVELMAVDFLQTPEGGVQVGLPERLFDIRHQYNEVGPFQVMPEGESFLTIQLEQEIRGGNLTLVQNWPAKLVGE